MPIQILMPELPDGAQAAQIVKWLVAEDDEIAAGDIIAEFTCGGDTAFLIEAADAGRVARLVVAEGATGLRSGQPIAEIADAGEDEPRPLAAIPEPTTSAPLSAVPAGPASSASAEAVSDHPVHPLAGHHIDSHSLEAVSLPHLSDARPARPVVQLPGARLLRRGNAATIVAYLDQDEVALAAARDLLLADGLDAEVIGLDTLHGPALEVICASVSRTGRLVVVEPHAADWPYAAEIAAEIATRAFDDLDAPPLTVRGARSPGAQGDRPDTDRAVVKLVAALRRICYVF
ncbi:MAG: transketolase C-terminal domain-containing protein [Hyphomicrobiaceae bacterium]|nr:transketolase C-terminal domain-containing protein [Hyphomicrobiaceae bacterium]